MRWQRRYGITTYWHKRIAQGIRIAKPIGLPGAKGATFYR
jgi:hypothetical protein